MNTNHNDLRGKLHDDIKRKTEYQKRWRAFDIFALIIITIFFIFHFEFTLELIAILLSLLTLLFAYINSHATRSKLEVFEENPPRYSESPVDGDTPSWFVRLAVANVGLSVVKNCKGKLLGVWDQSGKRVTKFDALDLFWTRQDGKSHYTRYLPVGLHGGGDFNFLDIAQIKNRGEGKEPIWLRVYIPPQMNLEKGTPDSVSPGVEPVLTAGLYFLQIAIYGDGSGDVVSPQWYKLYCKPIPKGNKSADSPAWLKPSSYKEFIDVVKQKRLEESSSNEQ